MRSRPRGAMVATLALTWAATAALNALSPGVISLPSALAVTLLVSLFAHLDRRTWARFR